MAESSNARRKKCVQGLVGWRGQRLNHGIQVIPARGGAVWATQSGFWRVRDKAH